MDWGSFAGGMAQGIPQGVNLTNSLNANKRAETAHLAAMDKAKREEAVFKYENDPVATVSDFAQRLGPGEKSRGYILNTVYSLTGKKENDTLNRKELMSLSSLVKDKENIKLGYIDSTREDLMNEKKRLGSLQFNSYSPTGEIPDAGSYAVMQNAERDAARIGAIDEALKQLDAIDPRVAQAKKEKMEEREMGIKERKTVVEERKAKADEKNVDSLADYRRRTSLNGSSGTRQASTDEGRRIANVNKTAQYLVSAMNSYIRAHKDEPENVRWAQRQIAAIDRHREAAVRDPSYNMDAIRNHTVKSLGGNDEMTRYAGPAESVGDRSEAIGDVELPDGVFFKNGRYFKREGGVDYQWVPPGETYTPYQKKQAKVEDKNAGKRMLFSNTKGQ